MKLLQINTNLNSGSTGRIAEGIGKKVIETGGQSHIAYGRTANPGISEEIKIGCKSDQAWHLLNTRIFDTHGFHSSLATKKLLKRIEAYKPDIIHLHNLHGYYLDIRILFEFLKKYKRPVVWTLHDCWAFTGHCCYYERISCVKWKSECHNCPLKFIYPRSLLSDNSRNNYRIKKTLFNSHDNLHLVTVSKWLESQVQQSFLSKFSIRTIYNGIDLKIFRPGDQNRLKKKYGFADRIVILGVANDWSDGKGLSLFLKLSKIVSTKCQIVLVGLSKRKAKNLPTNITAVHRTKNQHELADYYNLADVFVSPSIAETFGMVVAEAMACGTPCVVNNASALPELVDNQVGEIVSDRTAQAYLEAITGVIEKGKHEYKNACVKKATILFGIEDHQNHYLSLYREVLNH